MSITHLEQILEVVLTKSKKRLAAAYANDAHTIGALCDAVGHGVSVKAKLYSIALGALLAD